MNHCPHCKTELAAALPKVTDTTQEGQENAMAENLRQAGAVGLTTDDFRAAGYYQVSARIWGLRARGFVVHTELYNGIGRDNVYHCRMARYRLVSEPLPLDAKTAHAGRKTTLEGQAVREVSCS
jgi:hypothetical protein